MQLQVDVHHIIFSTVFKIQSTFKSISGNLSCDERQRENEEENQTDLFDQTVELFNNTSHCRSTVIFQTPNKREIVKIDIQSSVFWQNSLL